MDGKFRRVAAVFTCTSCGRQLRSAERLAYHMQSKVACELYRKQLAKQRLASGASGAAGATAGAAGAAGAGANDLGTSNNEDQDQQPQLDRMDGRVPSATAAPDLREYLTYRGRENVGYSTWIKDLPLHPHYAALLEHVARFVDCHPLLLHAQVQHVDALMKGATIFIRAP